jgi:hypothetical protein
MCVFASLHEHMYECVTVRSGVLERIRKPDGTEATGHLTLAAIDASVRMVDQREPIPALALQL